LLAESTSLENMIEAREFNFYNKHYNSLLDESAFERGKQKLGQNKKELQKILGSVLSNENLENHSLLSRIENTKVSQSLKYSSLFMGLGLNTDKSCFCYKVCDPETTSCNDIMKGIFSPFSTIQDLMKDCYDGIRNISPILGYIVGGLIWLGIGIAMCGGMGVGEGYESDEIPGEPG
ncbi:MAG: hypothetical protein KKB31_00370, partial [Nanoarchaeota archaeon]|nr:hypothetical protein [Nanoarchaeota archaeon]